jgi:hypothetical protein
MVGRQDANDLDATDEEDCVCCEDDEEAHASLIRPIMTQRNMRT